MARLGRVHAGVMGTDQKTINRLCANCRITGEKLWQLPLDEEYRKAILSEIADIKNVGDGTAGAIAAAKFLQEFAEDTPWVHLDIAGTAWENERKPYAARGPSGVAIRTLINYVCNHAAK